MFTTDRFTSHQAVAGPFGTVEHPAGSGFAGETLVEMVKSKSEKGFNLLYDNYCGALYSILLRFVQRREVADDLLQDVFVKIWKNIDRYDPGKGALFTWMLNIARNQAIDYLRSTSHRQQRLHVNNDLFSFHTHAGDPVTANSGSIEFNDIKNKALGLDPKYAAVIDLIFFYGCTQEQAARIMKLPLGTIKTRARKGLRLLKGLYLQ